MRYITALIVFITIGCGSRTQLQLISDARAEAKAYETAQELVKAKIGAILVSDVIALTENYPDLPPPTATSYAIVANPAILDKQVAATTEKPPLYVPVKCAMPDQLSVLLTSIGSKFVVIGSLVVAAAILFAVVSLLVPALAKLIPFAEEAGILGAVSVLIGACFIWIGERPMLVYATAGILAIVLAIRYRKLWLPGINRLLGTKPKPKLTPTLGTTSQSLPITLKGS